MKRNWKKTIAKITFSIVAEILLNLVGLDDIANMGEFVFGQESSDQSLITNCVDFSLVIKLNVFT